MLVRIKRSSKYVRTHRISEGQNVPEAIDVEVDPADLAESTRAVIIAHHGMYPATLECLLYSTKRGEPFNGYNSSMCLHADAEADEITPATIDALIARHEAARQEFIDAVTEAQAE